MENELTISQVRLMRHPHIYTLESKDERNAVDLEEDNIVDVEVIMLNPYIQNYLQTT